MLSNVAHEKLVPGFDKLEAVLQASKLSRTYPVGRASVRALDSVDIEIRRGEFVAIMGPSGCGKSTLLNLLGGLDQPTAGTVWLDGRNLADFNEEQLAQLRREKMGFVFQRHDLFPVLTALENVEFPMLLSGRDARERREHAQALLELVGLASKEDNLPDELSGGQQQRVGLARSLANSPLIMLADEPTGNLDSATATEIMDVLVSLVRDLGLTLVIVTHDSDSAKRADRIVHLKDGRVDEETSWH